MSKPCECTQRHHAKRIVLTGGPGAGKTAILELIRLFFCRHLHTLPEAAGIVFGGGFPRDGTVVRRRAAQRAIYHVQRELEYSATEENHAIVLCDRGTIDGAAYWKGDDDLWSSVGTTRGAELSRYDAVIHLRTPGAGNGYDHSNPLRVETVEEALAVDARIAEAWSGHPRLFTVVATTDFLAKAARTMDLLRAEMPSCCGQASASLALTAEIEDT
jgi:predicted ATPase